MFFQDGITGLHIGLNTTIFCSFEDPMAEHMAAIHQKWDESGCMEASGCNYFNVDQMAEDMASSFAGAEVAQTVWRHQAATTSMPRTMTSELAAV